MRSNKNVVKSAFSLNNSLFPSNHFDRKIAFLTHDRITALIVTKPISDEIRKGNQFFAKAATFKGNDRICKMKGNEMY